MDVLANSRLTADPTISSPTIPEGLVLVIMTGGTICMKNSQEGLVPERGFLDNVMAPRQELNDGTSQNVIEARIDGALPSTKIRSLRTPVSSYGKRVRLVFSSAQIYWLGI